ncbi:S4 domain-containing protein [Flavobacteriaceae bacterium]|jgi:23S rRNA pseudouridine2605 synthase|nr:rRNA pseudouridine synthase [Flavobacteriaceae bacterium]MBT4297873.1 rRNA pseudouridine synthase [Flavobacteriaceae bacterium]MBT4960436.1 rRNA pseudouridine synthase [Flavobacteriaceae bacterium]MBT5233439.1 rRNA pseudouridine synthase [Flavobacteriaceae bacterium]MBT6654792.1 rRNA pseudouridine synthase [Flavobacteriaceae bacterium]|tara:strand:- start:2331 stop:3032 length:702 start_codon:yes stop_codon:yes gene_type:complete
MESQLVRLNKYISNSGLCTRREADDYIQSGRVFVNNKLVEKLGLKISLNDEVKVDGDLIYPYKFHYLLLNKPLDFDFNISGKKNVLHLMSSLNAVNLRPIQPTVKQFSGLVLISNDNQFNNNISKRFNSFKQLFHIRLKNVISIEDLHSIKNSPNSKNIEIISIDFVTDGLQNELGLEVSSGKQSSILNLFEKYNHKVISIDRVLLAGLSKKDLPRGKWRTLKKQELVNLNSF